MNYRQEYKHPLLETNEKEEIVANNRVGSYSVSELIVICVSIVLLMVSITCGVFWLSMGEDPNPAVGFAIVPVGILHSIGFIISIILPIVSFEEELKTKKLTLVNLGIYLGSIITLFL